MQRRILHALVATFLLLYGGSYSFGQAEVRVPTESLPEPPAIERAAVQQLLQDGYALERQRRWADALLHYEDASRAHPNQRDLYSRLQLVRIHFDLSRRYADRSFVETTRQMSSAQALDLFDEVCVKIQSYYVESPDWKELIRRGNRHLEVALRDGEFIATHRVGASAENIDRFVRYLHQATRERSIRDRQSAHSFAFSMAQVGQSQLGLPAVATILEYVCGSTSSLDEYSTFLTPEQLDDVYSQIEGNFVGLGIELKASGGDLLITSVIRGGPASRAGIVAGDRIVEVDRKTMRDISTEKAADLLKGEQGTTVQVVVVGRAGAARRVNVRRERVEVPSVEDVKLVVPEAGIGYMKLTSFQKTTSRDVDTALWQLHRKGMRSLIIDVRGNPGGLLNQSVEIADKFVRNGTIVSTRGRSPREDFDYKAHREGTWGVSLVVLIDGDSASASEIFAAAIRDHARGTIVGYRSYGKGSVQGIFPLRIAESGVRLTTAKFYSPSGHPISRRGVQPDIVVRRRSGNQTDTQDDAVLSAGIEAARQQVAQR